MQMTHLFNIGLRKYTVKSTHCSNNPLERKMFEYLKEDGWTNVAFYGLHFLFVLKMNKMCTSKARDSEDVYLYVKDECCHLNDTAF